MDTAHSENDLDLKRLFRTVAAKKGRADFLIIDNSEATDADLIKQISSLLEKESIQSTSLDLSTIATVSDLLDIMKEHKQNGYDFLHITGGDAWFQKRQAFNDGTALGSEMLNIVRENMFKVGLKATFYLSESGIANLATQAPDLWAWRGGIYKLNL